MFDVLPQDVTVEGNDHGYIFIKKNCSCLSTAKVYASNTTYTMKSNEGYVYDIVIDAYDGLGFLPNTTRLAKIGAVISLSMDSIEAVNGIGNPDNVTVGALYYIPLNSVPGEPYPVENDTPPSPTPVPEPSFDSFSENLSNQKTHVPYGWIIGGLGIGLALIIFCIVICVCLKSSSCFSKAEEIMLNPDGKSSHKFHILRKPSFCCASGSSRTDMLDVEKPVVFTYEEIIFATDGFSDSSLIGHGTYGSVYYCYLRDQEVAVKRMTATKTKEFMSEMKVLCKVHHTNLVELIGYAASDDELFLIYEYAQKGSLKNHLHDPQNKGYTSLSWIMRVQVALDAARGLEYIHEHTKTHYVHRDIKTSNILLDGSFRAKISDFGLAKLVGKRGDGEATTTKVVGTFGYLLQSKQIYFFATVAYNKSFNQSQLLASLLCRYLSDGLATAKSDVYAFGVVLFEIISGKEAIIRTEGAVTKNPERRSLHPLKKNFGLVVPIPKMLWRAFVMFYALLLKEDYSIFVLAEMLAALRNSPDSMSMSSLKEHIDPNMMDLYPHDCVFKVAMLAKQCVDEDPILRPDMKQVVISLSQILLSSIEWEATLAGNSQVFSGLVQGDSD
ncbi:hypothetical protein GH714_035663 [Hevea brasiliensis]|uniref:non-specific serine/threonine protein kinase n=1 Tax=Hevea brasiliensis TaxID=3981 RepID=A0A6A6NDX1_HEVBR|nr:hypothetical protein GH714_035663 [Hevea brasiliensis]